MCFLLWDKKGQRLVCLLPAARLSRMGDGEWADSGQVQRRLAFDGIVAGLRLDLTVVFGLDLAGVEGG